MTYLDQHTIGEKFELLVSQSTVDFTATPVTIVIDGPESVRIVLRYLNGGTDGVLEVDTHGVRFTKIPPWSEENFALETRDPRVPTVEWDVRVLIGTAATNQNEIGLTKLPVNYPLNGALPTAGV